mmetsp:Transcript_102674/g.182419  ORF Transcript_102674/g.182419 Transcript_102674/m.182419 type:complete len:174 (-) Transcript_102674:156-677(-)
MALAAPLEEKARLRKPCKSWELVELIQSMEPLKPVEPKQPAELMELELEGPVEWLKLRLWLPWPSSFEDLGSHFWELRAQVRPPFRQSCGTCCCRKANGVQPASGLRNSAPISLMATFQNLVLSVARHRVCRQVSVPCCCADEWRCKLYQIYAFRVSEQRTARTWDFQPDFRN